MPRPPTSLREPTRGSPWKVAAADTALGAAAGRGPSPALHNHPPALTAAAAATASETPVAPIARSLGRRFASRASRNAGHMLDIRLSLRVRVPEFPESRNPMYRLRVKFTIEPLDGQR